MVDRSTFKHGVFVSVAVIFMLLTFVRLRVR
jgi:hypothetical protein